MKFGQAVSTRRDLLPDDIANELAKLQDRVPPFDGAVARATIEAAYGKPISDMFESSSTTTPLAAASIAQVHAARISGDRDVVVKVLRPGMRGLIERDLEVMHTLAGLAVRNSNEARRLRDRRDRRRVREDHPR